MLTKLLKIVKLNYSDFGLVLALILMGLIGFGLGYLNAPVGSDEPIIIYEPEAVSEANLEPNTSPQEASLTLTQTIIASKNSDKYHHPDCPWSAKIADKNKIIFSSEEEARKAGYQPCGNFEKYSQ